MHDTGMQGGDGRGGYEKEEERGIERIDEEMQITFYVVLSSIMASSAGLMFGFCVGISG